MPFYILPFKSFSASFCPLVSGAVIKFPCEAHLTFHLSVFTFHFSVSLVRCGARIVSVRVLSFVFPISSNERTLISLVWVISEVLFRSVVVTAFIKTVTLIYIITDIYIYYSQYLYIW